MCSTLPGETHAGNVVVDLEGESVKIGALQKEPTKDNYITNREQEYSYGVKIKLLTTKIFKVQITFKLVQHFSSFNVNNGIRYNLGGTN